MNHQTFRLTWNSYSNHLRDAMKELLQTGTFSDVTIVCDDKVAIAAHKFILRTCSQTFKDIVDTDSVIHISGVNHNELMTILEFIYLGQVQCDQDTLPKFLNVAKDLQLKDIKLISEGEAEEKTEEVVKNEPNSETSQKLDQDQFYVPTRQIEYNVTHQFITFPEVRDNESTDELQNQNPPKVNTAAKKQIKPRENGQRKDYTYIYSMLPSNDKDNLAHCPLCDAKYVHRQGLRRHFESKHVGKRISCNYCDYKATQESDLKKHTDSIHNGIKFPCSICDYKASRLDGLRSHEKHKHRYINLLKCNDI